MVNSYILYQSYKTLFLPKKDMALTPSTSIPLGFDAPGFNLENPISGNKVQLSNCIGQKGTLIMFICNHCPYVIHSIDTIVDLANEYQNKGINFVAINSNDVKNYPEDSPKNMISFAQDHTFTFPYLYDESQNVAKEYDAACTPDFYLLNNTGKVVYRGRLDASRPGNNIRSDGEDMRLAFDRLLNGQEQFEMQYPSLGCNIKWK